MDEGNRLFDLKRYEEALAAFEQVLHLDPNAVSVWKNKGMTLREPRAIRRGTGRLCAGCAGYFGYPFKKRGRKQHSE